MSPVLKRGMMRGASLEIFKKGVVLPLMFIVGLFYKCPTGL
jgi:hypothetical protein